MDVKGPYPALLAYGGSDVVVVVRLASLQKLKLFGRGQETGRWVDSQGVGAEVDVMRNLCCLTESRSAEDQEPDERRNPAGDAHFFRPPLVRPTSARAPNRGDVPTVVGSFAAEHGPNRLDLWIAEDEPAKGAVGFK